MERVNWLVVFSIFAISSYTNAQCIVDGPTDPSNGTDNNVEGTVSWVGTGTAGASDDFKSTATATTLGELSHFLVVSDLGFSIPAGVTICGITVEIEKSASGLLQDVKDRAVNIVKGGVITGNNNALPGIWPVSDAYFSYGGSSDLWGETWTVSDINASDFGVGISVTLSGFGALPTASIDHIRVTVDYDNRLPIELNGFGAKRTECATVELKWSTLSEKNNHFFTIERSLGIPFEWQTRGTVDGAGNSETLLHYAFEDNNNASSNTYYRIKQTDYDGQFSHSPVAVAVACSDDELVVRTSFNWIEIELPNNISQLQIFDNAGRILEEAKFDCQEPRSTYLWPKTSFTNAFVVRVLDCQGQKHSKHFAF
ncbi:MAG: hypothetical protein AAFX87_00815 [Bacteroidota bacterium]